MPSNSVCASQIAFYNAITRYTFGCQRRLPAATEAFLIHADAPMWRSVRPAHPMMLLWFVKGEVVDCGEVCGEVWVDFAGD
ncbi:hypothetical protein, partial [Amycolatopsis sp. NPDC051128]|uniref:hypothetical protein n=1 Tax=Amycolatopsis sp. NPDC051128 TaxID=3155412 RepID=UPI0034492898